jgi:hypothetical protein
MPQENLTPPTIGRVVLVRLFSNEGESDEAPAIVNAIDVDENTVDVLFMPAGMSPWPITGLAYYQEDELPTEGTVYDEHPGVWRWMPYQLGAHAAIAAKQES